MSAGYRRFLELPRDELALLRERAQALAKTVERSLVGDVIEVLQIPSRGQMFALPITAIEGISDLVSVASIPNAPPFVRGLVGFRGEVLIGMELSLLIGGASMGIGDLRRIICVAGGGMKVAFLAEKALSVRSVSISVFRSDPVVQFPFIIGTDSSFVSLLDPAALLAFARRSFERGSV